MSVDLTIGTSLRTPKCFLILNSYASALLKLVLTSLGVLRKEMLHLKELKKQSLKGTNG